MVSNHEEFSANLDEIQFFGSSEYPPVNGKWLNLTSIFPSKGQEQYLLELDKDKQPETQKMIRYLKVVMIGQSNNKLYCTLTNIHVSGKRMQQVLRDNLKEASNEQIKQVVSTQIKKDETIMMQQNDSKPLCYVSQDLVNYLRSSSICKVNEESGHDERDSKI